jgi:hypothetical protein
VQRSRNTAERQLDEVIPARARQTTQAAQAYSLVHARLSIGIGASWRDHEQNGRCTKELL